ncbi:MAG: GCN5-related N-acetyltransferase [Thermomicrobiales bacterium]|nr:GCN5-related N-acetyltransferase [Thermomicrobiales bacterium]
MSDPQSPVVNIEGELVSLGPLRREAIHQYVRWMNDFSTTRTLAIQPRPMTLEQETAWYEQAATNEQEHNFSIFERSSGRLIGNCGMFNIVLPHRRAEVGIVIGESDARGRGYGTEAMRLLLDYAFSCGSTSSTPRRGAATKRWGSARSAAGARAAGSTGASGTRSRWTSCLRSSRARCCAPCWSPKLHAIEPACPGRVSCRTK